MPDAPTTPPSGSSAAAAVPAAPATSATAAPDYVERLWPGPLGWALVAGSAVAAGIIGVPVHPVAALVAAGVTLAVAVLVAVRTAPVVRVQAGVLQAGAARIPVSVLGDPVALDREGVRRALGPGSDARAFVCLRAWLPGGVTVPVQDPADPTPSWLVSTRRPAALASAIAAARQAHSEQTS